MGPTGIMWFLDGGSDGPALPNVIPSMIQGEPGDPTARADSRRDYSSRQGFILRGERGGARKTAANRCGDESGAPSARFQRDCGEYILVYTK